MRILQRCSGKLGVDEDHFNSELFQKTCWVKLRMLEILIGNPQPLLGLFTTFVILGL